MARVAIGADEKKKLYVLGGLLAAILVVVFVLYRPGSSKSPAVSETPPPAKTTPAEGAPPPAASPDAPPSDAAPAGSGGTGGGGAGGISAASLVAVSDFRSDPFEPVPLPPPLPTPPPPPPPVAIAPPTVIISGPGAIRTGGALPPFGLPTGFGGTPPSRILHTLPAPRIPQIAIAPTAPANFVVPGGGEGSVSRAPNKRLSGVIIGDSVRALLEISDGETTVTRVVQPGDETDGIRILRIERTNEGGRPVTRMFIRENNEERYVDLRAAPQQAAGATGAPGTPPGRGARP